MKGLLRWEGSVNTMCPQGFGGEHCVEEKGSDERYWSLFRSVDLFVECS